MRAKYRYKLFLAGAGAVGKTTLLNRFTRGVFESFTKTIGVDFATHEVDTPHGPTSLQIWDFGGQEEYRLLLPTLAKGSDGSLLLFDLTRGETFDELPGWVSGIRAQNDDIPIMLCGAKYDLLQSDVGLRCVSIEDVKELVKSLGLRGYIEVSSKTGFHVQRAFELVTIAMVRKGEKELLDRKEPVVAGGLAPGNY
ncbi:MAG: Rab family GTPase [Promethearchaeota archaeon]